jgi:hypothetical protein
MQRFSAAETKSKSPGARMPRPTGRNIALSLPRRFICDLLHFAQRVPSVPVQRRMNLAAVVGARQAAQPRPSWSVIFAKAFSMVATRRPELRRAYLSFPKPHFYEHGGNVASIALEPALTWKLSEINDRMAADSAVG